MSTPEQKQIKKLYHAYRHTKDIDQKGLYFSPTCMQICRQVPAYAATSRDGIVRYLKDAQEGKVPAKGSSSAPEKNENLAEAPAKVDSPQTGKSSVSSVRNELPKAKNNTTSKIRAVYTIRPLHISEHEFAANTVTASVGYKPEALKSKAEEEGWIGMRVDLWDEGSPNAGLLVKVQYWWRWEAVKAGESLEGDVKGYGWRQCMHDIMYLGPKNGTEGEEGLEVLE